MVICYSYSGTMSRLFSFTFLRLPAGLKYDGEWMGSENKEGELVVGSLGLDLEGRESIAAKY